MKKTYIHANLNRDFWMYFTFFMFIWGQGESFQDMLGYVIYYPFANAWFAWLVLVFLTWVVIVGLPKRYWKLNSQTLSLHFLGFQKQAINLDNIQRIDWLVEEKLNIYKDDKLIFTVNNKNCHNVPKFVNELQMYQPRLFDNQEKPFINYDVSLYEKFFKLLKVSILLFISYVTLRWLRQDLHIGNYQMVTIIMLVSCIAIALLMSWKNGNRDDNSYSKELKETIKKLKFGVIPLFSLFTAYNAVLLFNEQLAYSVEKTTQKLLLGSKHEKNQTWCLKNCSKAIYRNIIYSNDLNNGLSEDSFYQVQVYHGLLGDIVVSVDDLANAKSE